MESTPAGEPAFKGKTADLSLSTYELATGPGTSEIILFQPFKGILFPPA